MQLYVLFVRGMVYVRQHPNIHLFVHHSIKMLLLSFENKYENVRTYIIIKLVEKVISLSKKNLLIQKVFINQRNKA